MVQHPQSSKKKIEFDCDTDLVIANSFRVKILYAGGYKKNISLSRYLHHLKLAFSFYKNAKLEKVPDLIVCSFPLIELTYAAIKYAKANKIPIVVDIRDPWPDIILQSLPSIPFFIFYPASKLMNLVIKNSFKYTSAITACSEGYLDWALKKFNSKRRILDKVFYLGCDDQKTNINILVKNKFRKLENDLEGKFIVFFVGTFGHTYDLDLVVKAARILHGEGNENIHFLLAGDGTKFSLILKKSHLLKNITFTGWLNQEDIKYLSSISDIGIIPMNQMNGCLPNKFYDYSCAGLPILSSLEGDANQLLREYNFGMTYQKNNEHDLVKKVKLYACSEEILNLHSRNSRFIFNNKFDSHIIYDEFAQYLGEIINAKNSLHIHN